METNSKETPRQQEQDKIREAVNELLLAIPIKYSELDEINNDLRGINPEDTIGICQTTENYRKAGLNYRKLILAALGILKTHHTPPDHELYNKLNNNLGNEPFHNLEEARDYRDQISLLLKNMLEYVDPLEEEIEAQKLIYEV